MPTVIVEPTKEHPIPYDDSDDSTGSFLEELAVAGKTAELKEALGASVEASAGTIDREAKLLEEVVKKRKSAPLKSQPVALAAASFLRTYGQQLAMDAAQARAAITHKLMEIANCGDPKYELKALELLGKHSDIGLFTERSEITINYQNPQELENAIKERVKRLLNAEVIDVTPLSDALDEELGPEEEKDYADKDLSEIAEDLFGDDEEDVDQESEDEDEAEPEVDVEAAEENGRTDV